MSDNKSHQVHKTELSIPIDLNNTVVWIISILSMISISSSFFHKFLVYRFIRTGTVLSAPIFITIVMFHSLFLHTGKSKYVSIFLLSF